MLFEDWRRVASIFDLEVQTNPHFSTDCREPDSLISERSRDSLATLWLLHDLNLSPERPVDFLTPKFLEAMSVTEGQGAQDLLATLLLQELKLPLNISVTFVKPILLGYKTSHFTVPSLEQ